MSVYKILKFRYLTFILLTLSTASLAKSIPAPIIYAGGDKSSGRAPDRVIISDMKSSNDLRMHYKLSVIRMALDATIESHGPYEVEFRQDALTNGRALQQIIHGGGINTYFGVTSRALEKEIIPIRIPIRMGILNYRLLLIHKDQLKAFEAIDSLEDLKKFKVGLRSHWVTRDVLEAQGFDIVTGSSYDGLFKMLNNKRFDFIPRGPNEIYTEISQQKEHAENLVIAPNIALSLTAPFYIFVSPHTPELAQRLALGLEKLVKNRDLRKLFLKHYRGNIIAADLKHRTIIDIPNPLLPKETPLDRKELWYWKPNR